MVNAPANFFKPDFAIGPAVLASRFLKNVAVYPWVLDGKRVLFGATNRMAITPPQAATPKRRLTAVAEPYA